MTQTIDTCPKCKSKVVLHCLVKGCVWVECSLCGGLWDPFKDRFIPAKLRVPKNSA